MERVKQMELNVWLPFLGTVIGTFSGIIASAKLTNYRLEQLEQKVNKHNNLIERTYRLEEKVCNLERNEQR